MTNKRKMAWNREDDEDIHSCSYYCTRPECVLAQRNELRDKQQAEREAIIQTIDELSDDRHPMFAQGYDYALRHIREFIEGAAIRARGKE